MRDPVTDPKPGDKIKCYHSFMDVEIVREVVERRGCKVIFKIGEQYYSVCVDLWVSLTKGGTVINEI